MRWWTFFFSLAWWYSLTTFASSDVPNGSSLVSFPLSSVLPCFHPPVLHPSLLAPLSPIPSCVPPTFFSSNPYTVFSLILPFSTFLFSFLPFFTLHSHLSFHPSSPFLPPLLAITSFSLHGRLYTQYTTAPNDASCSSSLQLLLVLPQAFQTLTFCTSLTSPLSAHAHSHSPLHSQTSSTHTQTHTQE